MSEQRRKFYVATGEARLIVCEDQPFGAALELTARLADGRCSGLFGPMIFVSQVGFRGHHYFDSETQIYSTWECLVLLGRIPNCTFEQFNKFLSQFQGGQNNANQDDE